MKSIDDDLVVFQSWPDFADSPRALYEFITSNTTMDTFWIIRNKQMCEKLSKLGICCALEGSELAEDKIASARFLVSAAYELANQKHTGQVFISTWHGFALKLTGFFESAVNDPKAFSGIRALTTQFDAVTMTSQAARLFFAGMHACDPRKVFATGFPRNDYLFSEDGRKNLSRIVGSEIANSKLVLYLPTMRKSLKEEGAQFENNIFNYENYDSDAINNILEANESYLIAKLHPSDNGLLEIDRHSLPSRVIVIEEKDFEKELLTLYHVLNAFDCLITDYSSVYVDYMLLNRPIIFSCPDLDQYEQDRGFCVDDPSLLMPGPIVGSMDGFSKALSDILRGADAYDSKRVQLMPFFHTHTDGGSSRRTYELMSKAAVDAPPDIAKDEASAYYNSNSPLYQYSLDVQGDIYLDFGKGFNENNRTTVSYRAQEDISEIEFAIPKGVISARFDPSEIGRFALQGLSIEIDNFPAEYEIPGGITIDDLTFLPKNDPKIIIPIPSDRATMLSIRFRAIDAPVQGSFGRDNVDTNAVLIGKIREKESEVSSFYNSRLRKAIRYAKKLLKRG